MSFRHGERRASATPGCNLNQDGLTWAACGKPLVSKWKALRSRGCSLKKCAGITTPRFPTGYSGPWKTLSSVPGLHDHEMAGQADGQETTPAGFPQPLFRCEGSRRLLRYEEVPPPFVAEMRKTKSVRAEAARHDGIRLGGHDAAQDAER